MGMSFLFPFVVKMLTLGPLKKNSNADTDDILQSYLVIWKWCRLFHMWLFLFIFQFTYMANCRFSKTSEQRLLYKQIKLHLNNISLSEQSLLFVKEQNIYTPSKSILHSSKIHFNVILCASFRYE